MIAVLTENRSSTLVLMSLYLALDSWLETQRLPGSNMALYPSPSGEN